MPAEEILSLFALLARFWGSAVATKLKDYSVYSRILCISGATGEASEPRKILSLFAISGGFGPLSILSIPLKILSLFADFAIYSEARFPLG